MPLDFRRISSVVDVSRLRAARVVVCGCGGSANLVTNLARSGVGSFSLIDPDVVGVENLVRQEYLPADISTPKVEALARHLRAIDSGIDVDTHQADLTAMPWGDLDAIVGGASLILGTTDRFAAQARVNELALKHKVAAIWPGIYRGGLAGEIAFWYEGLPCYRCLVSGRYRAQSNALAEGRSLDPPSDGTTIFDDAFIDSIAGMLSLGLLTRDGTGRFASLIHRLGDRNFLRVKIDPGYAWNGRDPVREALRVDAETDTYFAWNTAACRDPDAGMPPCPDCERYLDKRVKAPEAIGHAAASPDAAYIPRALPGLVV